MPEPVVKTIDVPCDQATAFRIFTQNMDAWWPKDRHSISAKTGDTARSVSMEPRAGGVVTEIGHDGTHHHWGSVREYEPNARLSLLWHINLPAEQATLVDIAFEPQETGTRVTLRHHGWEAMGDAAQTMRDGYESGWVGVFETAFAEACRAEAA
ncbi:hypothetical protein LCGC14_0339410 [marine sediment metagenome]